MSSFQVVMKSWLGTPRSAARVIGSLPRARGVGAGVVIQTSRNILMAQLLAAQCFCPTHAIGSGS